MDQPEARSAEQAPAGGKALGALGRIGLVAGFLALGGIVVVGNQMAGEAEADEQLRWLVWGVVGLIVVLVGSGLFGFVGMQRARSGLRDLDAKLDDLHRDLVSFSAPASASTTEGGPLALDDAETYHRPGCPVLEGKAGVRPVDQERIGARRLRPCTLCEPALAGDPNDERLSGTRVTRS